jgi:hypothetical protein
MVGVDAQRPHFPDHDALERVITMPEQVITMRWNR